MIRLVERNWSWPSRQTRISPRRKKASSDWPKATRRASNRIVYAYRSSIVESFFLIFEEFSPLFGQTRDDWYLVIRKIFFGLSVTCCFERCLQFADAAGRESIDARRCESRAAFRLLLFKSCSTLLDQRRDGGRRQMFLFAWPIFGRRRRGEHRCFRSIQGLIKLSTREERMSIWVQMDRTLVEVQQRKPLNPRAHVQTLVSGHLQHQRRLSSLSRATEDEATFPVMGLVIDRRVPPSLDVVTMERREISVVRVVFDLVQAVSLALLWNVGEQSKEEWRPLVEPDDFHR